VRDKAPILTIGNDTMTGEAVNLGSRCANELTRSGESVNMAERFH
jgi:hypothetical protein